jgi:hypothetical protein
VWGVLLAPAALASPAARLSADIGPRPLAEALDAFARQTGLQLIYLSSIAETEQSKGAPAGLTASEALAQLLDGTGLRFEFLNTRTVRIFPAPVIVPTLTAASPDPPRQAATRVRGLEEVLVTGTRGQEPLSRVPVDMAVWTEEAMEVSHIKGMAQLGALTPGVGFAFSGVGGDFYTHLDIRGVTNRSGATVGLYVDDSPIPPSRAATYLFSFPLTFDLDRVEILRGPQTVLLGDHCQAGAIRFLANQPSLTASTGSFRAEWGTTEHGSQSYEAGGAVGGPLVTDVLGFRVSGWFREDGGYVDRVDPVTGAILDANSNRYLNKVVRGAVTFAPNADVQVTPSLLYQSTRVRDTSSFDATVSDPGQGIFRNPSPVQQPFEDSYYLASLKLTARLPAADFSAVASYFDQTGSASLSALLEPDASDRFGLKQRSYSAEVQLSSSAEPDATLSWISGVSASGQHAHNPVWPAGVYSDDVSTEQSQVATFGQIALKMTKRLTVSAGVRIGRSRFQYYDYYPDEPPPFHGGVSDTWTAPRLGISWQADENNLVYLTIAKGYGSAAVYPLNPSALHPPDALWSYEIGSKHELFNSRLSLETNLFHIQWDNGPPNYDSTLGTEHDAIPGKAVSNGFGLTLQAWVSEHTRAALGAAYTDAHVTQTQFVGGVFYVGAGDSLGVSPWNVTASVEQEFPLRSDVTATLRVEDVFRSSPGPTYLNDPQTVYAPSPKLPPDPSTNVLNARLAIKWAQFELAAFLSNALDAHPTLNGSANGADNLIGVYTLVPRTLSLSGTWRY